MEQEIETSMADKLKKSFCNKEVLLPKDKSDVEPKSVASFVADVVAMIVDAEADQVLSIYDEWRDELCTQNDNGPLYKHIPNNERNTVNNKILSDALHNAVGPGRRGIDFPVWFKGFDTTEPQTQKPLRLMIVGQDPLRNPDDYIDGNYPIGTPFAVHDQRMRKGPTVAYWKIFETCLKQGHDLYVTDLHKVFCSGPPVKDRRKADAAYQKILQVECKTYSPDAIIVFGKRAFEALDTRTNSFVKMGVLERSGEVRKSNKFKNKDGHEIPLIPLLHPSGSARGYLKPFLDANNEFAKWDSLAAFLNDFMLEHSKKLSPDH
jgi:hypothetical protein